MSNKEEGAYKFTTQTFEGLEALVTDWLPELEKEYERLQ